MMRAIAALPTCRLGLRSSQGEVEEIVFMPPHAALEQPANTLEARLVEEISHYLTNPQHMLVLPLAARGTPFQQRVWQAIRNIPPGRTSTYGELAYHLGSSPRAVGQACGANPFPLITPCHRVLGKHSHGGFAHASDGWLLATKRWLLQHEGEGRA